MHIKHQDNPEFAVEFELPSTKQCLVLDLGWIR
jgi:hypothetical protein